MLHGAPIQIRAILTFLIFLGGKFSLKDTFITCAPQFLQNISSIMDRVKKLDMIFRPSPRSEGVPLS